MPPADDSAFGHNTEVAFRHRTYHVQTESVGGGDGGEVTVVSLVYHRGELVRKIATRFAAAGPAQADGAALRAAVRRQHRAVVAQVQSGQLLADGRHEPPRPRRPPAR